LEGLDGSVVENVKLEQLARRLGCLKKSERIGIPTKRTREEANELIKALAKEITASKAVKKANARDIAQFARLASRFEN
jgi:hypothetical protein